MCVCVVCVCTPMGTMQSALLLALLGCSLTVYASPFSLSCKGGDFSVIVDVTRDSYTSPSSARKKTAEDLANKGESSLPSRGESSAV